VPEEVILSAESSVKRLGGQGTPPEPRWELTATSSPPVRSGWSLGRDRQVKSSFAAQQLIALYFMCEDTHLA